MGSFHVNCPLSGMSIGPGDKAVFLPLFFNKYADRAMKEGMIFTHPFEPGVPVFGTYADYGYLDPEAGGEQVSGESLPDGMAHCFVKREVWDLLTGPMMTEYGQQGTAAEAGDVSAVALRLMGFVEAGETGLERYNRKFTRLGADNAYVANDGTWCRIVSGIKTIDSIYHPELFAKIWKRETGQEIDLGPLERITPALLMIREKHAVLKAGIDSHIRMAELYPESETDSGTQFAKFDFWNYGQGTGSEQLTEFLTDRLRNDGDYTSAVDLLEEHIELFAQLLTLGRNLRDLGLMLRPGVAGPQCGNMYAERQFYKRMAEIAEENYQDKKRNEEPDDDEGGE